jgi:hypothetical protein
MEGDTLYRSSLSHYATSRKVADSIPDDVIRFLNWPYPWSRNLALVWTQPLIEMNIRNLPAGKGRPARKADNLTAIWEPIVYENVAASTSHNPIGLHRPLQG